MIADCLALLGALVGAATILYHAPLVYRRLSAMTRSHRRLVLPVALALLAALLLIIALATATRAAPPAPPTPVVVRVPSDWYALAQCRQPGRLVVGALVGNAREPYLPIACRRLLPGESRPGGFPPSRWEQPDFWHLKTPSITLFGCERGLTPVVAVQLRPGEPAMIECRAIARAPKYHAKPARVTIAASIPPGGSAWRCSSPQLALIVTRLDERRLYAHCARRLIRPVPFDDRAHGAAILPAGGAVLWCRDPEQRALFGWPAGEAAVVDVDCGRGAL